MKNILLFIFFTFCLIINAQTNKIIFEYDGAGNQIKRSLCLNCPSLTGKSIAPKKIETLTNDDLLKFSPEDFISYYPNPVKEELFVRWDLINGRKVISIQVFSITGQILKIYNNLSSDNQNIAFQSYSSGVYAVILYYSNGEQKTIKIIKQ